MRIATFSFDDGHARDKAVIRALNGQPATFYVVGDNCANLDAEVYAGQEIGCHSMTHPRKPWNHRAMGIEIEMSRDVIRDWCGSDPVAFAYPCGKATLAIALAVRASGYGLGRTYAVDPENAWQIPEPFLVPVTGYLDRPIDRGLLGKLMDDGRPIHLAGHGKHFDDAGRLLSLANLTAWFVMREYEFVTNSEYVRRCLEAEAKRK